MDPTDPSSYTHTLANVLLAPFQPNPAYTNPQFALPTQVAALRSTGQATSKPMPVHRPAEGWANIIRALVGGNEEFQADQLSQNAYATDLGAQSRVAHTALGNQSSTPAVAPPTTSSAPTPSEGSAAPLAYTAPDSGQSGGSPPPTDVGHAAMDFYKSKGLSPVAAAGLAGGFANEGSPTSSNPGDGSDGSTSVGIGQWNGSRAQALQQFAAKNGMDPQALRTQLEFSWNELNGPEAKTLSALQSAQSPQDAAVAAAGYERPAGWTPSNPTGASHFDQRLASTNALLGPNGSPAAGGASDAIANAAPQQGGVRYATPADSLPFSGPSGAGGASPTPAYPVGGAASHAALIRGLMNPNLGTTPNGANPQDIARALMSPYSTPDSRAVASSLVTPQALNDGMGNTYLYRNGQPLGAPLLHGMNVQHAVIGGQTVPIGLTGDPQNPQVRLLSPNAGGGGGQGVPPVSPQQNGGSPAQPSPGMRQQGPAGQGGPMDGYMPLINQGQQIQAQGEAAATAGKASGDQLAHDRQVAGTYSQTTEPLLKALPALEALGPTGTGPGTQQFNQLKSTLQSLGLPGFDPNKISNYDQARDYLGAYVAHNGGTNQLVGAFSGDPTATASNAAAVDYVKSALALQRLQQAKVLSFESKGLPESQYSKYAEQFASTQDPRAYGFDLMSKQARAQLGASMPPGSAARTKFNASYKNAMASGLVPSN